MSKRDRDSEIVAKINEKPMVLGQALDIEEIADNFGSWWFIENNDEDVFVHRCRRYPLKECIQDIDPESSVQSEIVGYWHVELGDVQHFWHIDMPKGSPWPRINEISKDNFQFILRFKTGGLIAGIEDLGD